jgi:hypothetical protein
MTMSHYPSISVIEMWGGSDCDVLSASIRLTLEHPISYLPDGEGGAWDSRGCSNSNSRSIALHYLLSSCPGLATPPYKKR